MEKTAEMLNRARIGIPAAEKIAAFIDKAYKDSIDAEDNSSGYAAFLSCIICRLYYFMGRRLIDREALSLEEAKTFLSGFMEESAAIGDIELRNGIGTEASRKAVHERAVKCGVAAEE